MSIALAIVPSTQQYNVGVGAQFTPPYNEMGGTRYVANLILGECQRRGITARVFAGEADPPSSVANVRAEYIKSKAWLDSRPEATRLCLSLHTDSAGEIGSHTANVYGKEPNQTAAQSPSYQWGKVLAQRVQATLGTAGILTLDYSDYLFYLLLRPHTSVLLEICAHDVYSDLAALYNKAQLVASTVVDGTLQFAAPQVDPRLAALEAENATMRSRLSQIAALATAR